MAESAMICECCWELFRKEVPAPCWMEWGEWLCQDCAQSAVDEHFEEAQP